MHDSVVVGDRAYTAVWVCNNLEASQLGYFWFRRQYKMVPHEYHKNMRSLAVVHPGLGVRMTLLLLSYMLKHSFWDKLIYADRIEFLDEVRCPACCSQAARESMCAEVLVRRSIFSCDAATLTGGRAQRARLAQGAI